MRSPAGRMASPPCGNWSKPAPLWYRSTTSGVESAIRHTIEIGWQRGNPEFMEKFFGYATDNGRGRFPTSASFIAKVADRLRLESRLA